MVRAWLCDGLQRIYPASTKARFRRTLNVARGERFSFQVGVQATDNITLQIEASAPSDLTALIRRVGYVPVPRRYSDVPSDEIDGFAHLPGWVPDALFDNTPYTIPAGMTQAYWISGYVKPDARPGLKTIRIKLRPHNSPGEINGLKISPKSYHHEVLAQVMVHSTSLKPRRNFDVTHWFYADALCDWYRVEPWSEQFWEIVKPYMRDLAAHGQNVIYVPAFTPPLDGIKRPTQLLEVRRRGRGRYEFDWRHVARWIATARACGLEKFEWCHLFTQWGAKHAIRIYEAPIDRERLLWPPETAATSVTYCRFLAQYLSQLHQFLRQHHLLQASFFHVSDEPSGEEAQTQYRTLRGLLREMAPWMRVLDATSDLRLAQEHLVDMPASVISHSSPCYEHHIPCWVYFCCEPRGRYLNRHLDTPLAKLRMAGWLFYRFGHRGFLHWGYNYWYKRQSRQLINPFYQTDAETWPSSWVAGDPFVVYPGPHGPLDSIRWEVFAESLQDYQLLQTLQVQPDALAKALVSYQEFPKTPAWIYQQRSHLLTAAGQG